MSDWKKTDFLFDDYGHHDNNRNLKGPSCFDTYEEFVRAQVEEIPEYLLVLLPYSEGSDAFKKIQLEWICDFWDSRKKLEL